MTAIELKSILTSVSGLDDFTVEFNEIENKDVYAYYYLATCRIELFVLEDDDYLSDDELIKTGLHELTHHMLVKHFNSGLNDPHGKSFKKLFAIYLNKYYNNQVPSKIIKQIKEEGLYYGGKETKSSKEERPARRKLFRTNKKAS
jgi:predicted SprT family Zn-dependent metalloprotease